MKKTVFLNGSQAIAEGSVYAGCRYYYSTPKPINNDILEYMSYRMPEVNGIFAQAETERSAIGMVIGSSVSGARVLTSSITDGISVMSEGINYLSSLELPCVIANIMYGRHGVFNLDHGQYGYSDFVKSSSHISNKFIVFSPHSVQEAYDLTIKAFELADKYRNPVIVLIDTFLAMQSENVEVYTELMLPDSANKEWKLEGVKNKTGKVFKNFHKDDFSHYKDIISKLRKIEGETAYFEEFMTEDAEEIVISFGIMSKALKQFIIKLRSQSKKIGLFRPISLSPFPTNKLLELAEKVSKVTVVEANTGLMYSDIVNIIRDKTKIDFIGENEELVGFRNIINEFEKRFIS